MINYADFTIEAFRAWLHDTEATATCHDPEKCVLAQWLLEDGFAKHPHCDGELMMDDPSDNPLGDWQDIFKVNTPAWCHSVMAAFDGMYGPNSPVGVEEYRAPLVALCDELIRQRNS